jgi:hypothetical protein
MANDGSSGVARRERIPYCLRRVVSEGLGRTRLRCGVALGAVSLLCGAFLTAASGQTPPPAEPAQPEAPVEKADDLAWKITGSFYRLPDDRSVDLNAKRQIGAFGAWLGVFHDQEVDTVARAGVEYDWHRGSFLVVPTVQAATNGLKAAQLYSELGGATYAIVGASRTNLRPFYNLSFDPNESIQVGIGRHLSKYDKVYAFTIVDVRLHTGQQNTHLLWRHRLNRATGLTFDALYKSGRTDSERTVHAVGLGAYLDRSRWFLKAYYDPYANFGDETMFRVGIGAKF